MRHIAWFSEAHVEPCHEGSLTSKDALVCHRCLAPAREIERLGIGCSVFGGLKKADAVDVSSHLQKLNSDIVVISKMTCSNLLKLARAAKHIGCYVVADLGHDSVMTPDTVKLSEIADQIIAATPEVAASLLEQTGHLVQVIADSEDRIGSSNSPRAIALQWLEVFKKLEAKPPLCANSNEPIAKSN
jgi:hypothetical protein